MQFKAYDYVSAMKILKKGMILNLKVWINLWC